MKNHTPSRQSGLSLVEMMIGLVLGLVLMGGVLNIFLSNRQAFRVTENLARLQENGRSAYEMLMRDIREAGGNPCGTRQIGNVLNSSAGLWWANWEGGTLRGFDNSAAGDAASQIVAVGNQTGQRVAGTDALLVLSGNVLEGVTISTHSPNGSPANFAVNTVQHGISDGDILIACDYRSGAIFQATNANPGINTTIVHNTGVGSPGNCSKGLGYPSLCTPNGTPKAYDGGGMLVRFYVAFWYIGNNARGGQSLFRLTMVNSGGNQVAQTDEVAEGIQNLQVQFLMRNTTTLALAGSYVDGSAVADWTITAPDQAAAARVELTALSRDAVGTNQQPLRRQFLGVAQLRNRDIP